MDANAILSVILRWVHITSVVTLLGGVIYARFFAGSLAPRFRGPLIGAMAGLIGSGLYTLLTKESLPPGYHMWFGIKMLLVLHIFGVGLMITTPVLDDAKKLRMMTGIALSGLTVLLISSWLRWMSLA
ncbi:MAG: hypothetical protein GY953_21160 [bacterium]|nr:hypothetical protein [bacterium]